MDRDSASEVNLIESDYQGNWILSLDLLKKWLF